jgi:hypothetical protein
MLITLKTAKLAKKKKFLNACQEGFKGNICLSIFDENSTGDWYSNAWNNDPDEFARPTQAQLQTWLRDNFFINIVVLKDNNSWDFFFFYPKLDMECSSQLEFSSYERALEAGLQQAIKELKYDK